MSDDQSHHLYYIGANQHIWQFFFDGQTWINQDVTASSGTGATAASGSAITSYFVSSDSSSHLFYIGADQHVYQLFYGQGWANQDLTALSGAVTLPVTGSALTSYFVSSDGSSHLFYIDTNEHVQQVFYYGSQWYNQDVTVLANGTPAASGTGLTSYFVDADGTSHMYYIGQNQHVYQLFFTGQAWVSQDLTALSNGVLAAMEDGDSSYFVAADASSHVYYVGENQHVYQVFFYDQNWVNQDLTVASGASVLAASGTGLTSYFVSGDASSHIYYQDTLLRANELVFDGAGWYDLNLAQIYSISGQVLAGTTPVRGVTINLSGSSAGGTFTDANGKYSFGLAAGGVYTLTPSDASGDVFNPALLSFVDLDENRTANFSLVTQSAGGGDLFTAAVAESTLEGIQSQSQGSSCTDITGTWVENTSPEATWTLTQSAGQVTGSVSASDPVCGTVRWTVSGSLTSSSNSTFTLYSNNPQPSSCQNRPFPSATDTVTLDAPSCLTGNGVHSVPGGSFSTSWTDPTPASSPKPSTLRLSLGQSTAYSNQDVLSCAGKLLGHGWGYSRCGTYTLLDQTGKPILNTTNYIAQETRISVSGNYSPASHTGSGPVSNDGKFSDFLGLVNSNGPIPAKTRGVRKQTISIVNTTDQSTVPVRVNCLVFTSSEVTVTDVTASTDQSCSKF